MATSEEISRGIKVPLNGVDEPTSDASRPPQTIFRVVRAAVVGTVVEYYDFGVYGYMATFVATLFFVDENPTTALMGTFAAFAVAFFLRLPGGIFFGHLGDKYGRKNALSWTISLMVLATVLMGLLPTYATLGVWATACLVLARCLQGFAAGGELGGANVFVAESAPADRRGLFTSMVNSGTYLGALVASLVVLALTAAFTEDQILDWAWRLPFLLSVILGGIGIWIRSRMEDTPKFHELENEGETKKLPIQELLTTSGGAVVKIMCVGAVINGGYYIASVYAASYIQTVGHHSARAAFVSTAIAMVLGTLTLPIAGSLSDRVGRRPVLFLGSGLAIIVSFPTFIMMAASNMLLACVGQSILFICVSIANGASYVTFAEMLKTSVRYSGISMGLNVSIMLLGGTAPFIATYLIDLTGSNLAPAAYFVFCAAITFIAVFFIRETKGIILPAD